MFETIDGKSSYLLPFALLLTFYEYTLATLSMIFNKREIPVGKALCQSETKLVVCDNAV